MKEIAGIPEGQLVKVNLKDPNDPGLRAFATLVWHLLKKAQEMEPPAREQGSGGEVKRVEREGSLNLSPNPSSLTPQKKVTDPQKCPQQTRTSSELEISPSSLPVGSYGFSDGENSSSCKLSSNAGSQNGRTQKRGRFRKPRSGLAQELKHKRVQAGLTQQQVAKALKVSRSTYADVERGLWPIPEHWLPRLKSILELENGVINAKNDSF